MIWSNRCLGVIKTCALWVPWLSSLTDEMRETTLLDVVWEVGNSGRITPVAILEPVILCGAEIKTSFST